MTDEQHTSTTDAHSLLLLSKRDGDDTEIAKGADLDRRTIDRGRRHKRASSPTLPFPARHLLSGLTLGESQGMSFGSFSEVES